MVAAAIMIGGALLAAGIVIGAVLTGALSGSSTPITEATEEPLPDSPLPTSSEHPVLISVRLTPSGLVPNRIQATAGSSVTLEVTSERDGTLHIEGYGYSAVAVKAGESAEVTFDATEMGTFVIVLHAPGEADQQIGTFVVTD